MIIEPADWRKGKNHHYWVWWRRASSAEIRFGLLGQGESFLGRKWLIGKKIKKELDKPEGISHTKMV